MNYMARRGGRNAKLAGSAYSCQSRGRIAVGLATQVVSMNRWLFNNFVGNRAAAGLLPWLAGPGKLSLDALIFGRNTRG